MARGKVLHTTVGSVHPEVLAFTAGRDRELDTALLEADCLGTAAHVTMLARMPVRPPVVTERDCRRVIAELVRLMRSAAARGGFRITLADQDVHLAVERVLTRRLGALGKKVHTGRSRNDQVAVDLRLYAKERMLRVLDETAVLAGGLLAFARRHERVPMVGRTHMQPAMPSTVGLWASAYAESLLDDLRLLRAAYALNDRCPLGSAASYGVPLPIDRRLTARLLGFSGPVHNVLHANNARGKVEAAVLSALGQVMLTLSRLAQDLMLFTLPEFGYFALPAEFATGSSIMPQKRNPDVLEAVRARAARVLTAAAGVAEMVRGLPSGYNRDVQETKALFMEGLETTRASVRILERVLDGLRVDRSALRRGFTPAVFATDRALELVAKGMPFRDAYRHVKEHLEELREADPAAAVARKTHLGAPAGLDWARVREEVRACRRFARREWAKYRLAVSRLMGVNYPLSGREGAVE